MFKSNEVDNQFTSIQSENKCPIVAKIQLHKIITGHILNLLRQLIAACLLPQLFLKYSKSLFYAACLTKPNICTTFSTVVTI